MTLETIASAATTYLLYAMAAVPFAVWSGRSAHASLIRRAEKTGPAAWPGRAATIFLAVLPACLITYFFIRGFHAKNPIDELDGDDWGQIFFLFVPPCCGMMLGYFCGTALARRQR